MLKAFPGKVLLIPAVLCALLLLVACGDTRQGDDDSAPAPEGQPAPNAGQSDGDSSGVIGDDDGSSAGNGQIADSGRKIVRTATVDVAIRDLDDALSSIRAIARNAGGFVADSNVVVRNSEDAQAAEPEMARISIRVPASQFDDVMDSIRDVAAGVDAEVTDVTEVTTEYTDLQSRLRNLQASEAQYLALLERATTIDEILRVQDKVNDTRGEIEQVQGRLNVLDDQTELATITVALRLVTAPAAAVSDSHWTTQAVEKSIDVSEALIVILGTVTIAAAFASLWVVPPVAIGYVVWRRLGPAITAVAKRLG